MSKSDTAVISASFGAGLTSPFIGIALGATVDALIGLLLTLGIIGVIGVVAIVIIQAVAEAQEIVKIILELDWPYIFGLALGLMMLGSS